MSVHFAKLTTTEQAKLLQMKDVVKNAFVMMLQQDANFWSSITTGTATKDSVLKRHKLFKGFLSNFIL